MIHWLAGSLRRSVGLLSRLRVDHLRVGGFDLDPDAAQCIALGLAELFDLRLRLLDPRGVGEEIELPTEDQRRAVAQDSWRRRARTD